MKLESKIFLLVSLSFIGLMLLVIGTFSLSDNKESFLFTISGNSIFEVPENFSMGDSLKGEIIISNSKKVNEGIYGILIITTPSEEVFSENFKLSEVIIKNELTASQKISLNKLSNYTFNEIGSHEIIISVKDLRINYKKTIHVHE